MPSGDLGVLLRLADVGVEFMADRLPVEHLREVTGVVWLHTFRALGVVMERHRCHEAGGRCDDLEIDEDEQTSQGEEENKAQ